jgi:hypothetical protein
MPFYRGGRYFGNAKVAGTVESFLVSTSGIILWRGLGLGNLGESDYDA